MMRTYDRMYVRNTCYCACARVKLQLCYRDQARGYFSTYVRNCKYMRLYDLKQVVTYTRQASLRLDFCMRTRGPAPSRSVHSCMHMRIRVRMWFRLGRPDEPSMRLCNCNVRARKQERLRWR